MMSVDAAYIFGSVVPGLGSQLVRLGGLIGYHL